MSYPLLSALLLALGTFLAIFLLVLFAILACFFLLPVAFSIFFSILNSIALDFSKAAVSPASLPTCLAGDFAAIALTIASGKFFF
jgi:hypothetical protein